MAGIENAEQYEAWNGESGQRWVADPDRRDRVLAEVADTLLAATGLTPGEHVLDIGCGCGATTLAAARAVAPDGKVTGVDLSAPMLEVARRRAATSRIANVTFVHADAQVHPFGASYDVAISRFGTMFFDDAAAAFANIAGALEPAGRLCLATWQPQAANEWLTVPCQALLADGSEPEPVEGPGMFAQADPIALADTLRRAGFAAVDVVPATVRIAAGDDPASAADYVAQSAPGRALLETIPAERRPTALARVRAAFADYAGASGVQLRGAILITTAHITSAAH